LSQDAKLPPLNELWNSIYGSSHNDQPERRLLAAVMLQGLADFFQFSRYREALEWVGSNDRTGDPYRFSYLQLCELLDIDAEWLRWHLSTLRARKARIKSRRSRPTNHKKPLQARRTHRAKLITAEENRNAQTTLRIEPAQATRTGESTQILEVRESVGAADATLGTELGLGDQRRGQYLRERA
jgi:hypothetical protein